MSVSSAISGPPVSAFLSTSLSPSCSTHASGSFGLPGSSLPSMFSGFPGYVQQNLSHVPPGFTLPASHPLPSVAAPPMSSLLAAQTSAGERLSDGIRRKIVNDEFVDFYDILFPEAHCAYTLSMDSFNNPAIVKKDRKSELTEVQWGKAFAEYSAIYLQTHPNLVNELLTYQKRVLHLMERKGDWQFFDVEFRKDREAKRTPWTDPRVDLYLDSVLIQWILAILLYVSYRMAYPLYHEDRCARLWLSSISFH